MESRKVYVTDIIPYANNPRNNDGAVEAVAESIRQCGYLAPIVVDEDMVILAGHTRFKAITEILGWDEVEVLVKTGLSEEQKRKYRLLDNKTNEFAQWDFNVLKEEVADLDFGFDFGIDKLLAKGENLEVGTQKEEKQPLIKRCTCPRCGKEFEE